MHSLITCHGSTIPWLRIVFYYLPFSILICADAAIFGLVPFVDLSLPFVDLSLPFTDLSLTCHPGHPPLPLPSPDHNAAARQVL